MRRLRILLGMIDPPLPFATAPSRWFYVLLRELVARGHDVTTFAACQKPDEIAPAMALFPKPEYDLRCYPIPRRPVLASKLNTLVRPYSYMFSSEMRRDFTAEARRGFDVIHLEQLWSAWLALEHVDRALVNVHHLTWIDLSQLQPSTLRQRLNTQRMWATERRLLRRVKHVRSCSPRLVPEILSVNPHLNVQTIPVGIDPNQYPYIPDERRVVEPVISVMGTMHWYPTRSAAERLLTRLWPEIKRRVPDARVQIVGWEARSALAPFVGMPDVTIEENVPDIQPYFERTSVMLYAPGRGSGMKIKIAEAMAYGIPVVTTSEGVEGIPAEDGVHAGICEDDAGLIDRAVQLLTDRELQNRRRATARTLFEHHCSPKRTVDAIESMYDQILAGCGVAI